MCINKKIQESFQYTLRKYADKKCHLFNLGYFKDKYSFADVSEWEYIHFKYLVL